MRKEIRRKDRRTVNPEFVLQDVDSRLKSTFAQIAENEEQRAILDGALQMSRPVRLSTLAWLITANMLMETCPHRAEQLLAELDDSVTGERGPRSMVARVDRAQRLYLRLLYQGSRVRVVSFNAMMAGTLVSAGQ